MKKLTVEDFKQIQIDILLLFDEYCKERGIAYSLAEGTMLGAVRHKGFIPWDDDIDLFMVREEYDRFIQSLSEEHLLGKYEVMIPNVSDNYIFPFVKIVDTSTVAYEKNIDAKYAKGVWIDIFPLDDCAEDKESARKVCVEHFKVIMKYMFYFGNAEGKSLKKMLKRFYIKFLNTFTKARRNRLKKELMTPTGKRGATYMGPICWSFSPNSAYPREYFAQYEEIEFEGRQFPVFSRYREILSKRYGDDYMEIPPVEKRISHDMEVYSL